MEPDQHPVLPYRSAPPSRGRKLGALRWVLPTSAGVVAGLVVGFTGHGLGAIAAGFVVGVLSAVLVPRRRLVAALAGSACVILGCTLAYLIGSTLMRQPLSPGELGRIVIALTVLCVLPGLVGAALVMSIDALTRPPSR